MDNQQNSFPKSEQLFNDTWWAFNNASEVLGFKTAIPAEPLPSETDGNLYSFETLQRNANKAINAKEKVDYLLTKLRSKNAFTIRDMDEFANRLGLFVLQVQSLSGLVFFKDKFKAYETSIKKGPHAEAYQMNHDMFAPILRTLLSQRPNGISQLSQLYEIPEMDKKAVDYFMVIQENKENDRRVWLRTALRNVAMYHPQRKRLDNSARLSKRLPHKRRNKS